MPEHQLATFLQHHPLYPLFIQVKNQLAEKGFVCWIAGGAVRDLLIGRQPADLDLVTDATTEQVLQIFPDALTVGVSFGVVKLIIDKTPVFDLATFRRESDYVDGRRPSHVDYATPKEDAFRRDFTINALFWNAETNEVVDFVQGIKDLDSKTLRCVGNPKIRFEEDHLRILRLLRFHVQLGFNIDPQTLMAAESLMTKLSRISGERLWSETLKMLPSIQWRSFLTTDFSKSIFYFLFNLKKPVLDVPHPALEESQQKLYQLFYILLKLTDSEEGLQDLLKTKWHLSKAEIKILESLRFSLRHQFAKVEWIFEAEKNPLLLEALRYLNSIGKFPDYSEISARYKARPEKLFSGNDLVGKVSGIQVGDVLKKIRLFQLEQPEADKSQILQYLYQNKIISM